jgi:hypothetical protein
MFNQLTNVALPGGLTNMMTLDFSFNPLTNCFIANGLTRLTSPKVEAGQPLQPGAGLAAGG